MIMFLDCETIPRWMDYNSMPANFQELYLKRFESKLPEDIDNADALNYHIAEHYDKNAGLYAEYNQIICVVLGYMKADKLIIKRFISDKEGLLLEKVWEVLMSSAIMEKNAKTGTLYLRSDSRLVAHNGMEFDFPMLFRRMLANGILIPPILNSIGKKPWEMQLDDTMKIWSGTAWNYKVSLDLLCALFNIKSPKQEITGADIGRIWYETKKENSPAAETKLFEDIGSYCERDVVALVLVYCYQTGQEPFKTIEYGK